MAVTLGVRSLRSRSSFVPMKRVTTPLIMSSIRIAWCWMLPTRDGLHPGVSAELAGDDPVPKNNPLYRAGTQARKAGRNRRESGLGFGGNRGAARLGGGGTVFTQQAPEAG